MFWGAIWLWTSGCSSSDDRPCGPAHGAFGWSSLATDGAGNICAAGSFSSPIRLDDELVRAPDAEHGLLVRLKP